MTDIEQKAREVAFLVHSAQTMPQSEFVNIASKTIAVAIQSAVSEEREECAKIPRRIAPSAGACINEIENAIRARGQKVSP